MLIQVVTTALSIKAQSHPGHDTCVRNAFRSLLSSPSSHGGRGASPSEGGHPSDLTYLAGGGQSPSFLASLTTAYFQKKRCE